MAVFKQKTTKGETKFYHYCFMADGKTYRGVCKGCTIKKIALEYERDVKAKVKELSKQKSVKALVDNFRQELTGGSDIFIFDAYELSLKKPRRRQPSKQLINTKRSYWRDFTDYMESHFSDIVKLADVRKNHAEEYVQFIRENGRFNKQVPFKTGRKLSVYHRPGNLSNKSCNTFQQSISEVFEKLYTDAGLIENPFSSIPKLNNESESREAFTEKELKLIAEKADKFIKPIFVIGIATALREGDICTLKWSEIDFKTNLIRRKMLKTRRFVQIPILPPLRSFLLEQKDCIDNSEYVLPDQAEMYLKNSTGISWRVKNFLESIKIKTAKKVPGRSRAVSIKDVHSLRHTFCYYAGVYSIPFLVVKDIVGHVSPQMTELYQRHADNHMKREKLMQMPDLMGLDINSAKELPKADNNTQRAKLAQMVEALPEDKLNKVINYIGEMLK